MDKTLSAGAEHAVRATTGWSLFRGIGELKARRAVRVARWAADAELLRRTTPPLRLAWRVEELVAPKKQARARPLAPAARARRPPGRLPNASPVNRLAVRAESDALTALADRLADLERAVAARGVLLVERLLTDGFSPLYERESADDLPPYPRHRARRARATLMVELLGITIAVACFLAVFGLLVLLDRV